MRLGTTVVAMLAVGAAGCLPFNSVLIQRASNEYGCPTANINVIARDDIQYGVFDVDVCGQRARYTCVGGGRGSPYRCVHEPDPPRWDPDPTTVASLLPPSGMSDQVPTGGRWLRICGAGDGDCFFRQNGQWYWRPYQPPACMGGVSLACQ